MKGKTIGIDATTLEANASLRLRAARPVELSWGSTSLLVRVPIPEECLFFL